MTEHDVAPKLKWLQLSTSQNSQNIPFCPENTDILTVGPDPVGLQPGVLRRRHR